jgi:hypothetical protein
MAKRGKSSGITNQDRKCGKAWKKIKKKQRKTGRTIGGYKPQKIEQRKQKRLQPYIPPKESDEQL